MSDKGPIGAIFDWDGVIIDSSAHHEESWERLAKETGYQLPPDHFKKGFGMKNEFIIPNLLQWASDPEEITRLSLRKETLDREIVLEWVLKPLPGVVAWLDRLRDASVPCAIGSSTHLLNIETGLALIGLKDRFQTIVTAEDVSHGKPDPEVFLKAGSRLGLHPECCVVFEDALVGIEAAHRGGMKVVAGGPTKSNSALEVVELSVSPATELSGDVLARALAELPVV